jgi:hypothetical protein
MNIALWIIQILLAAFFLTSGSVKLVLPKNKLARVFDWIDDFSQNKIKLIGAFEVIGAFGLFLPGVYSFVPALISISAAGLSVIMILALLTHYNRGEKSEMISNIVIFVLLAIIIIGRLAF